MATIYKRKKSYYLNWHDDEGQHRKSLGQISKAEAIALRDEKRVQLRRQQKSSNQPFAVFGDVAVDYLDWRKAEFPDSHARIEFIVEKRLQTFHDKPMHAITQQDVERWKAGRSTQVAAGTVAKELRTLKAVFNKAIEWGLLDRSPARFVRPPKQITDERMTWYTPDELAELYKANPEFAPIWRLLANTGIRRTEAQQLRWTDVKPEHIEVISRTGARTKSGKSRNVPLNVGAREALEILEKQTGEGEYVLPEVAPGTLSRWFRQAADGAGLSGSLHSLRHTFCANLVSAGIPLRTVQSLAGHASYKTTETYAHLAPEVRQQAVDVLNL